MIRWPFRRAPTSDASYIAHLEEEVRWLRQVAHPLADPSPLARTPPPVRDHPPQSLIDLCAMFETHGPQLLADCRKQHDANGTPYDYLEQRIRESLAQQVAGTWQES
jgi:hypothetical protein